MSERGEDLETRTSGTGTSAPSIRAAILRVTVLLVGLATACLAQAEATLRFVVWDGDTALNAIRKAADEFEQAHPGIKVKLEPTAYAGYQDKLLAQIAANCAPDVVMMDPGNFQRYARRDALIPLNELFKDDAEFNIKDYYAPIVRAHSIGDQLYVLPRDIAPIGLVYYNKAHFREAGLPEPDGSWTWDFKVRPELREKDFLWTLQQLTKIGKDGKVERYAFCPGWPQALTDVFAHSQGATYVDDPERVRAIKYDDPRVIKAFQLTQDLFTKHKWVPSPIDLTTSLMMGVADLFVAQKISMMQVGIWEVPNIRKKLIPGQPGFFEWDICLMPAYKDGTRAMPTGGSGYCITRQTKHPKEAWLLTKWMAGKPGMLAMAEAGLAQPAIASLAQEFPWIPGPKSPPEQQYPKNRIVTHEAVPSVVFEPTSDYWPEIRTAVNPEIDRIWTGGANPEKALKAANAAGRNRLNQILQAREMPSYPWGGAAALALLAIAGIAAWVYWPERHIRRTQKEKRENRAAYLFIAPWLIGLVLFTLGPMMLSLMMSLADWDIITAAKWRGGGNYAEALYGDPKVFISLRVTAIYTAVSVPLGIVVALMLALLLNTKIKGMPLYRTCFYLPSLTSGVAMALIWKSVFKADGGLLNALIYGVDGKGNPLGLAGLVSGLSQNGEPINWLGNENTALPSMILMALWGAGGGMVVLLAGLQGIPEFYYEAATVDGAGPVRKFFSVTLPMLTPALLFSLITGLIGSFQVFTQAFVMTGGGPGESTLFYMLHLYNTAFVNLRMGYASALAWLLFLIILVLTMLQMRLSKYVYYEAEAK